MGGPPPPPKKPNFKKTEIVPKLQANGNQTPQIDVTKMSGYTKIADDCPDWKRALLEKKNRQLEAEEMKRKLEEEKWKDIPEWKRNLLEKRK